MIIIFEVLWEGSLAMLAQLLCRYELLHAWPSWSVCWLIYAWTLVSWESLLVTQLSAPATELFRSFWLVKSHHYVRLAVIHCFVPSLTCAAISCSLGDPAVLAVERLFRVYVIDEHFMLILEVPLALSTYHWRPRIEHCLLLKFLLLHPSLRLY